MIRVLFVCHGNICRSPMAEFILKDMVQKRGIENQFEIASAATSTEEIWNGKGNPIYPPARREMEKHNIPFDISKRAVQLKASDYETYDYIIAMDSMNVRNINRITGSDKMGKVHKLMEYIHKKGDVADPWYSGNFEVAFSDIYNGCTGLLNHIQSK